MMHDLVKQFLEAECSPAPDSFVPFRELWQRFQTWLPAGERRRWQRQRFMIEVGKVYPIGHDSENNRAAVGGLSFVKPRRAVVDENGKLRLTTE